MEESKPKIRNQILQVLKMQGAQTATALATELQVSPMAIRQHLQILKADHWVTYEEEKRPMGRPVKLWQLTAQARIYFPDSHADLMVDLLRSLYAVFGMAGVERLLADRGRRQAETYRDRLREAEKIHWRQKVAALAQWRTQEGYMAEVIEQADQSVLFVENHCPICTAAQTCQMLCTVELDVFQAVFGPAVTIERVEHVLQGDRRCAYRVTGGP